MRRGSCLTRQLVSSHPETGSEGMRGRGSWRGTFGPSTHQFLTVSCVHASHVEIYKSKRQLIDGVYGVLVRLGLHLIYEDGFMDRNDVKSLILVARLVMHVALQRSRCIVSKPTERSTTSFGGLTLYLDGEHDDDIALEISLLCSLPRSGSKERLLECIEAERRKKVIEKS